MGRYDFLLWRFTQQNSQDPTDIHRRSQNWSHFYPGMGLKLEVFTFSPNQNNCGSSDAYVTCIYCSLNVKINVHKTPCGTQRSWTYFFCVCFLCLAKTQRPPNLSPMVDDAITQGSIGGLGSPLYICV